MLDREGRQPVDRRTHDLRGSARSDGNPAAQGTRGTACREQTPLNDSQRHRSSLSATGMGPLPANGISVVEGVVLDGALIGESYPESEIAIRLRSRLNATE
jgi:hypothetical protein